MNESFNSTVFFLKQVCFNIFYRQFISNSLDVHIRPKKLNPGQERRRQKLQIFLEILLKKKKIQIQTKLKNGLYAAKILLSNLVKM